MPKRRLILGILALGILAALIFTLTRRNTDQPEPLADGKPLSYWLEECRRNPFDSTPANTEGQAAQAVRKIGTNAIPALLRWIEYEARPPSLPTALRHLDQLRHRILPRYPCDFHTPGYTRKERLHGSALAGFAVLGPEAKSAVPALSRLVRVPKDKGHIYVVTEEVLAALALIGEAGFSPSMQALTNRHQEIRVCAARTMFCHGTNAAPALPVLITYLKESDETLAAASAWSLGRLRLEPELVVPALIQALSDPRKEVRECAGRGLAFYGSRARFAISALQKLQHDDSRPEVRQIAGDAIFLISRPDE
jgi:hypothetical protein